MQERTSMTPESKIIQRMLSKRILHEITERTPFVYPHVRQLAERFPWKAAHVIRTAEVTDMLGNELKLHEKDWQTLNAAALLHDIGFASLPEKVVNKPGLLTSKEREVLRTHSDIGAAAVE